MSETPAVVVVSGHMIDAPDRKEPRFPPSRVERVARELEQAFDAWGVGAGTTILCGGARGADILAAEVGLRRGASVYVCLALPPDDFERGSVALPGTDWAARFRSVLERAEVEINAGADDATTDGADVFGRANARLVELANSRADRPHAALVWDGGRGDGPGGTADLVRRLGFRGPDPRACVIDPTPRDYEERQSSPGPKRMLALDGGGIRGALTLEILRAIESHLRARRGDPNLMLSDYFDYIGGTSTGAIIAAALAMGKPVSEVRERYEKLGKKVFQRRFLPMRLPSLYRDGLLTEELENLFGHGATLGDPRLRSLLLLVLHDTVTDSPWPVTNCTRAKYNRAERNLITPPIAISTCHSAHWSVEARRRRSSSLRNRFRWGPVTSSFRTGTHVVQQPCPVAFLDGNAAGIQTRLAPWRVRNARRLRGHRCGSSGASGPQPPAGRAPVQRLEPPSGIHAWHLGRAGHGLPLASPSPRRRSHRPRVRQSA